MAGKGTVDELVGWLSTLDQDAKVSILIDEEDMERIAPDGHGIYRLHLTLDDSDGHVFFYVGLQVTTLELKERVRT